MTYISTQSLTSPLRQSVMQTQSQLAQVQSEVSSGNYADIGLTLGGTTGTSLSLKSEIDNLTTLTNTNAFATTRLSATATALTSLVSSAQTVSTALVAAPTAGGSTSSVQQTATSALQQFIATMNTSVANQYVFSGDKTDTSPIADYFSSTTSSSKAAVDSAFQTTFGTSQTSAGASTITGAQMSSFLDTQFNALFSSSSWQSSWSSASSTDLQTNIAPGQSATTSVDANQGPFRQLAAALTMVTEFTGSNFSDDARNAVISKATGLVNSAISGLTSLEAGVGTTQQAISSANDSMSAQMTTLKSHVSDLESVDTYSLSTQLSQLQTQLETSYALTNRLQQLSLTNYLSATG